MVKAELSRQLMIKLENTAGTLAEVTSVISSHGINILALCAYAVDSTVAIMFVTADNNASKQLLGENGIEVQEEEVVLLTLNNEPGALQRITDRIAQENIDLALMYGSASPESESAPIVLISNNNLDVMMVIKTEMERS